MDQNLGSSKGNSIRDNISNIHICLFLNNIYTRIFSGISLRLSIVKYLQCQVVVTIQAYLSFILSPQEYNVFLHFEKKKVKCKLHGGTRRRKVYIQTLRRVSSVNKKRMKQNKKEREAAEQGMFLGLEVRLCNIGSVPRARSRLNVAHFRGQRGEVFKKKNVQVTQWRDKMSIRVLGQRSSRRKRGAGKGSRVSGRKAVVQFPEQLLVLHREPFVGFRLFLQRLLKHRLFCG